MHLLAALLAVTVSGFTSPVQQDPPFEADIKRFEAADAQNPPAKGGVVFVGSSSIVLWKTLKEDFPKHKVINRGFGGSQLSDSVRNAHRIVTPYEPKMVFLFAGTNDIASGKSAETVFADYRAFVVKVRSKIPNIPIAYISISPAPSRWDKIAEIMKANKLIEEYSKGGENLFYINTFKRMLNAEYGPRPELFVGDQLHMNEKGYAIWKEVVGPYLPKK